MARHKAQLLGAVGAVNREPLSERVYQTLRGAILSGGVKLGDHLSETGVARQMEVSPTPVREALRRLAAEGLVVISSYKGAVVQEFADQQIIEIYQCREALKKALNRAIQAKHPLKLSETNSIFHNIIVSYARNSRVQSLLGLFNDVIMRDRNVIAYSAERPEQIHAEHATILEALADGDGERAEAAMRLHVRKGLEFISRRVQDRRVQDAEREE